MSRITGLATGLDVDALVKNMLTNHQSRIDKVNKQIQILQWKQEMYRETMSDINKWKSTYFNVTSSKNMLSSKNYSSTKATGLSDTSGISVTTGTGAIKGEYKVKVNQTATAAKLEGNNVKVSTGTVAKVPEEGLSGELKINVSTGEAITVNLDGKASLDEVADAINDAFKGTSLEGNVTVANNNGKLAIINKGDKTISFEGENTEALGLTTTTKSTAKDLTLANFAKAMGINESKLTFKVNDKEFSYDLAGDNAKTTVSEMMTAVSKEANVTFTHSNLTDDFVIVSKDTGSSAQVKIEGEFMKALFGNNQEVGGVISTSGRDAEVYVTSPYGSNKVISSSNKITFDGVTIDINKSVNSTAESFEIDFKVESNVENTFNNIKELVDEYNKMIDTVYGRITEKKQYSYTPLTDEEKEEMTEKEIELWEKKCKQGILKNDTYLTKLTSSLREAFSMPVEGSTISLSEIGISFDADYTAGPKLTIDEDKLKKALEERGDEVEQLFIKTDEEYSSYDPNMSAAGRKQRFNNSGIFQRVSDVLNDAYRTTRDKDGRKGYLLEVAGLEGDTNNTLYKNIQTLQDKLSDLQDKYNDAEDRYYSQFASLETAMNNLNSQQLWLSQQLGLS